MNITYQQEFPLVHFKTHQHNYKHLILYPLQPEPLFPINNITLRSKVDLGSNLVKSWLEKFFLEK